MKSLKDHVILYDAECPMCKVYTRAFTTTGMLDDEGRAPYQHMPEFACPLVDRQRAVNEIALIDKTTGEVRYGIDSLFAVIANSFPMLKPLFSCKPFHWIMRKTYAFISYNRKVIIPANGKVIIPASPNVAIPAPKIDTHVFQPTFKLRYRLAYLVLTCSIVTYLLTALARQFTGGIPAGTPWHASAIVGGQLLIQGLIISVIAPAKRWEYLGNMMTISLAGALLLLPLLAAASLIQKSPGITTGYFLLVATAMLLEHLRRTKLLSLSPVLTVSWLLYPLLILFIIL
ncbi:hypothetical protein [Puia sp.]|uniref:hypothetical protein n=1 Tax=Puia sp. TaxID=2045100 RepID=UPI002F40DA90